MNEAQAVLPGRFETTEIHAREGVALLTRVQKREQDSLLLVQRNILRRRIFAVVLRGDEPVQRAMLYSVTHLLVGRDNVLCYGEVIRCPLVQIRPDAQRPER